MAADTSAQATLNPSSPPLKRALRDFNNDMRRDRFNGDIVFVQG
jgi:hypothetical protein